MLAVGLLVAVLTIPPDDPTRVDVVYYSDRQSTQEDFSPRQLSLRSGGEPILFPGSYRLETVTPEQRERELAVEIRASDSGASYRIRVSADGELLARGLGLPDPANPHKLLVSGWTGDVEPYGVARYRIVDEHAIDGYYISKMTPDHPGTDSVSGDTTAGFEGSFVLNSKEVNGRSWGPHEWTLTPRGQVTYLRWREDGKVISRGFGIADPDDPAAIVVTYIPVGE